MPEGKIRRLFSGGNTPLGFYSFYDYIIGSDARRIFVIEGGSGASRTCLMKGIAETVVREGLDVELHLSAMDNELMDAVVVPELAIALVDGSARLRGESRNPGAVETILNLQEIEDDLSFYPNREELVENRREIGRLYRRAYDYLAIAKIFDDIEISLLKDGDAIKWPALYAISSEIVYEMFGKKQQEFKKGRQRHLFASAFTPEGLINFLDSIFSGAPNLWILDGPPGSGEEVLIERVIEESSIRGHLVEIFHCPLNPRRIEHVLVPSMGLGIVTSSKYYHHYRRDGAHIIDSTSWLDMGRTEKFNVEQEMAHGMSEKCFEQAVNYLRRAKHLQDILDINTIPGTDFEAIDRMTRRVADWILAQASRRR